MTDRNIPRKCRHFNGIQHKRCEQGIEYSQWLQQKLALPCLPDTPICSRPLGECSSCRLMTPNELQEEHDRINAAAVKALPSLLRPAAVVSPRTDGRPPSDGRVMRAHSKSEYKRLTAQGAEVLPPEFTQGDNCKTSPLCAIGAPVKMYPECKGCKYEVINTFAEERKARGDG